MLFHKSPSISLPLTLTYYLFLLNNLRVITEDYLKNQTRMLSSCAKISNSVYSLLWKKVVRTLQALKSKSESTLTFRGDNHPKDISNSSRAQGVNHSLRTRPPTLKILFCAVGCNPDTENLPWGQHQTLQRIPNRTLPTEAKSLFIRGRQIRCTEGLTDALLSWLGE